MCAWFDFALPVPYFRHALLTSQSLIRRVRHVEPPREVLFHPPQLTTYFGTSAQFPSHDLRHTTGLPQTGRPSHQQLCPTARVAMHVSDQVPPEGYGLSWFNDEDSGDFAPPWRGCAPATSVPSHWSGAGSSQPHSWCQADSPHLQAPVRQPAVASAYL